MTWKKCWNQAQFKNFADSMALRAIIKKTVKIFAGNVILLYICHIIILSLTKSKKTIHFFFGTCGYLVG